MKAILGFVDTTSKRIRGKRQSFRLSALSITLLFLGFQADAVGEEPLKVSLIETHLVMGQEAVIHLDSGPPLKEGPGNQVLVHIRGEDGSSKRVLSAGKGIRALREDRITLQVPPDMPKGKPVHLQVELRRPEGPVLSNVLSFTAVVAHISGRVIRMVNGTPIVGAEVSATPGNISTLTDQGGFYNLSVEKGRYTLRAHAPNFLARTEPEVDTRTGTAEIYFELDPDHGQLAEAIRHALQVVQANPSDPKAHFELGSAYIEAGQSKEAIAELSRVLELQPGHIEAHHQLAFSYWRTYQYARAKEVCLKGLEIDASHKGLQAMLGRLKVEGH